MTIVAQLGCGYWGPNLLRNLMVAPDCRVKWVADPSEARRRFVSSSFPSVAVTPDWREVLDDPEVEAVVIATPAGTHAELALAALDAGKHILVEKPLAYSGEAVERIAAAAGDRVVMVGHTFLYNGAVRHLKGLIDSGELGEVYYVTSARLNLGMVRSDVNVWWNLAPHDLSILLYLFDGVMPSSVSAEGQIYLQKDIEDVAFAHLRWADGRAAHLHVSWLDPGKSRTMTVVGSRKMVVYDDIADNKISILDRGVDFVPQAGARMDFDAAPGPLRAVHRSGDIHLPRVAFDEPLRVEIAHFLECVRSGGEPLTGLDHARQVVTLLEAGARAMREGCPVEPLMAAV